MFLDRVEIYVKGGDGGNGSVSFRREKYVPEGGPDGGDGGRGADVVLTVKEGLTTLSAFRYVHHFRAPAGSGGSGSNMSGRSGQDMILEVPPGTVVFDKEKGTVLADLTEPKETYVIAKGGRGGRGNARFRGPVERLPRFAEKGEIGEELWVRLELKLLAEVGLVGLPNAGKSSLLSRVTRAQPKIGAYPFTTLHPELGVVEGPDYAFVAADLPGLIEGAHEGKGLGHDFLRHVERTRVLVHVVDLGAVLDVEEALAAIGTIEGELRSFREDLLLRPRLFFLNKLDLPEARERAGALEKILLERNGETVVLKGSAATGEGVDILKGAMAELLKKAPPSPAVEVHGRPVVDPTAFSLLPEKDGYRVRGVTVERRVDMTDLANPEATRRLSRYLKRKGVEKALWKAGASADTPVYIGEHVFELLRDDEEEGEAGRSAMDPESSPP